MFTSLRARLVGYPLFKAYQTDIEPYLSGRTGCREGSDVGSRKECSHGTVMHSGEDGRAIRPRVPNV